MQEILRNNVKIVKALYGDIYSYKDIADFLGITINSFYNWLGGYYCLGTTKEKKLKEFVNDILN